jgi:phosphate transport system permease protein
VDSGRGGAAAAPRARSGVAPWQQRKEVVILLCLLGATLVSVLTTGAIIWVLASESLTFFRHEPLLAFLTGTRWAPLLEPRDFGVLPLICGTLLVAAVAAVIALPLGLASAIYLSEYASDAARRLMKPTMEVLAGIPTVVFGYFAIAYVTPALQRLVPETQVFNAASAGIVVGIMILPMVSSLCEDALAAVPRSLRHGAFALGATRLETITQVVVPAALSGIMASYLLAISRAVGETMAVTLAAGASPKLTLNPLESVQTMTAYIVQVSLGDTPAGTIEYQTIFAVGLTLFVMTAALNLVALAVVRRFRQIYD